MRTHVRYLQDIVCFYHGFKDIKAGEVVKVHDVLGSHEAWVGRDNGDTWAEIGIDGTRAEWAEDLAI